MKSRKTITLITCRIRKLVFAFMWACALLDNCFYKSLGGPIYVKAQELPSSFPSVYPTKRPTKKPTPAPTKRPTRKPSASPLVENLANLPSTFPSTFPTMPPTKSPIKKTPSPSKKPSKKPTPNPTRKPTKRPTKIPTSQPSLLPTFSLNPTISLKPSAHPTAEPSKKPTRSPTAKPTRKPTTKKPTRSPTRKPSTSKPSKKPSTPKPLKPPSKAPIETPTGQPFKPPTSKPTFMLIEKTSKPTKSPTREPTRKPTKQPTRKPISPAPTRKPTLKPTRRPTKSPTPGPTQSPTTSFPTKSPTFSPSLSEQPSSYPTLSTKPTNSPSISSVPTFTSAPTESHQPSSSPTVSGAPTLTMLQVHIKNITMTVDNMDIMESTGLIKLWEDKTGLHIENYLGEISVLYDIDVAVRINPNGQVVAPTSYLRSIYSKLQITFSALVDYRTVVDGFDLNEAVGDSFRTQLSRSRYLDSLKESPDYHTYFSSIYEVNVQVPELDNSSKDINPGPVEIGDDEPSKSNNLLIVVVAGGGVAALVVAIFIGTIYRSKRRSLKTDDTTFTPNSPPRYAEIPAKNPGLEPKVIPQVHPNSPIKGVLEIKASDDISLLEDPSILQNWDAETKQTIDNLTAGTGSLVPSNYLSRIYGSDAHTHAPTILSSGATLGTRSIGNQDGDLDHFTSSTLKNKEPFEDECAEYVLEVVQDNFKSTHPESSSPGRSVSKHQSIISKVPSSSSDHSKTLSTPARPTLKLSYSGEKLLIQAPPGKLGIVVDSPYIEGPPVIHAIKDSSVLKDSVEVGDYIVAFNGVDTAQLSAMDLTKLISEKIHAWRTFTIFRSNSAIGEVEQVNVKSTESSSKQSNLLVDRIWSGQCTAASPLTSRMINNDGSSRLSPKGGDLDDISLTKSYNSDKADSRVYGAGGSIATISRAQSNNSHSAGRDDEFSLPYDNSTKCSAEPNFSVTSEYVESATVETKSTISAPKQKQLQEPMSFMGDYCSDDDSGESYEFSSGYLSEDDKASSKAEI